jgi:hypothetical protein
LFLILLIMFAFIAVIVKRETRLPLPLTCLESSKIKVYRQGRHELFISYGGQRPMHYCLDKFHKTCLISAPMVWDCLVLNFS